MKFEKLNGTNKKLIGLQLVDKGIPRSGYKIYDKIGVEIGYISSGTHSPSLEIGIGLGYVNTDSCDVGTDVYIEVRNKKLKAKISKLPFVKNQLWKIY